MTVEFDREVERKSAKGSLSNLIDRQRVSVKRPEKEKMRQKELVGVRDRKKKWVGNCI